MLTALQCSTHTRRSNESWSKLKNIVKILISFRCHITATLISSNNQSNTKIQLPETVCARQRVLGRITIYIIQKHSNNMLAPKAGIATEIEIICPLNLSRIQNLPEISWFNSSYQPPKPKIQFLWVGLQQTPWMTTGDLRKGRALAQLQQVGYRALQHLERDLSNLKPRRTQRMASIQRLGRSRNSNWVRSAKKASWKT